MRNVMFCQEPVTKNTKVKVKEDDSFSVGHISRGFSVKELGGFRAGY